MKTFNLKVLFAGLLLLGLLVRVFYAGHIGFTNDEGAYLFDAKNLLEGVIAKGDFLTKTPAVVSIYALAVGLFHNSLFAARIVSILASVISVFPIVFIVRKLYPKAWIFSALAWLTFAGPTLLGVLGQTESLAVLFSLAALAFVVCAFPSFAFLSGISFGLAFASRKVAVAALLPIIYYILTYKSDLKIKKKFLFVFAISAIVVLIPWAILSFKLFGAEGLKQFAGIGYSSIIASGVSGLGDTNVWGVTKWQTLETLSKIAAPCLVFFLFCFTALFAFPFAKSKNIPREIIPFLIWITGLLFLYGLWPVFLVDYSLDFFPPLIIASSIILAKVWNHYPRIFKITIALVFLVLNIFSYVSVCKHPWTGMFDKKAVTAMATVLKDKVPVDEPVLTAAVIVPYLSGHKVAGNIGHPLWYRYNFIKDRTKNTFLPPFLELETDFKQGKIKWLLMEHLTDYVYLRGESNLINEISENWVLRSEIENDTKFRSNRLKLFEFD